LLVEPDIQVKSSSLPDLLCHPGEPVSS